MKTKATIYRLLVLLLCASGIVTGACEPEYCANCFDTSGILKKKEISICTNNHTELEILMHDAWEMGYDCEYE